MSRFSSYCCLCTLNLLTKHGIVSVSISVIIIIIIIIINDWSLHIIDKNIRIGSDDFIYISDYSTDDITQNYYNQNTTTPTTKSAIPNWFIKWLKRNNSSEQASVHPTKEDRNKTYTESSWQECGSEGWQVDTSNLHELETLILEKQPSLIKYEVNLQFADALTNVQFHWVLDAKGQWIRDSLVCTESWLAIKLGMFQQGVYSYNVKLMVDHPLKSYDQDEIVCITDNCLQLLTTTARPNTTQQMTGDREVHLYHARTDYNPITLSTCDFQGLSILYWGLFSPLILCLFPYFIINFLSRSIPKVCLQNDQQTRLHLNNNQLPIGLKYVCVFWKPSLHPMRVIIAFILFIIFPKLKSFFHIQYISYKDVIFNCSPILFSFGTLFCILKYSKSRSNRIFKVRAHIKTDKLTWLDILLKLEQDEDHKLQTFQGGIDFLSSFNKQYLKYFTNHHNWLYSHRSYMKAIVGTIGLFIRSVFCLLTWFSASFGTFLLLFLNLPEHPKYFSPIVDLLVYTSLCYLNSSITLYLPPYVITSIALIAFLLCYPVMRWCKNRHIRILPAIIGVSQLIVSMWSIVSDYISMCLTLMIGLLIDHDVAGPLCFLLVAILGIIVEASTSYYVEYAQLFRLTVQAAENVHKDLSDLAYFSKENLKKFKTFHGVKYKDLLKKAVNIIHPESNVSLEMLSTLMKYTKDGEPTIETKLFWAMVNKHKPRIYTSRDNCHYQMFHSIHILGSVYLGCFRYIEYQSYDYSFSPFIFDYCFGFWISDPISKELFRIKAM